MYYTENIYSTPPRSRSVGRADAKTGSKLLEGRRRQALSHDVRKLLRGGYVEDTYMTESHLFPNKMNVELDVFGATMMDRIGGEVDGGDVVAEHHGGLGDWTRKLLEKLAKPRALGDHIGHDSILGLSARMGDRSLSLGRP